jgi:hypothetical protein
MDISIGEALQNWLLRNRLDVTSDVFVAAADLAFENEIRNQDYERSPNKNCMSNSAAHFDREPGVSMACEIC